MGKSFRKSLDEQLRDPEFRAEWDDLEPNFQIVRAIIEGRSANDLTEAQLSEITGIGLPYIRQLEAGTANPSLRTLKRLAAGMGMKLKLEFVPVAQTTRPSAQ